MKTHWRQLLLIAMVATVFGYLGANFHPGWLTSIAQAQATAPVLRNTASLEERITRLEKAVDKLQQQVRSQGMRDTPKSQRESPRIEPRDYSKEWKLEQEKKELERRLDCIEQKARNGRESRGVASVPC